MTDEDEGMDDFEKQFATKFGTNKAATDERLAAERKAGLTAKQRAARKAKSPPKKQKNFRASPETLAQLEALTGRLNTSETDIIAIAIDALAKKELGDKK
jgi:hypothetical protein